MSLKIYGKNPEGARLERIKRSPHYRNGIFTNLSPTQMMAENVSVLKNAKDFFGKPKDTVPPRMLPSVRTDLKKLPGADPQLVWFGHSSYLIHIDGKNILVDPVFSGNASPVSFMIRAFEGANVYAVKDLPEIDLLVLTHDHYDHLDYKTIMELQPKIKKICCPLGVGSHLEYWGIRQDIVTELDWWENHTAEEISLTATPARHFTGRGLTRAKTLWASFVLKCGEYSLFLGGDSGYDTHFKSIGDTYGPFDLAILESGQYNTSWPLIHMMPEQTVQAAVDLKAKVLLPVHWAKFSLAMHAWDEPIKRVLKKAAELRVNVTTPMIGEPVSIRKYYPNSHWWEPLTGII